jgi:hypothetical protein
MGGIEYFFDVLLYDYTCKLVEGIEVEINPAMSFVWKQLENKNKPLI